MEAPATHAAAPQPLAKTPSTAEGSPPARPAIRPRNPELALDARIPRHWMGGRAVATHIANGVNLLFPAGERFFVRSVRHYLDRIDGDPELMAQVKGFFGQEGRHAREHERAFTLLEAQGFRVRPFLDVYERVAYGWVERVAPPALRLAATAAAEHYTAIMAENALRLGVLDDADPAMQKLLLWHACEEIEHRSVAFEVLRRVSPGYATRMAGLAMATAMLGAFWVAAAITLARQDGVTWRQAREELRAAGERNPILKRVFWRGIREYVRRDFDPADADVDELARAWLRGAGMA